MAAFIPAMMLEKGSGGDRQNCSLDVFKRRNGGCDWTQSQSVNRLGDVMFATSRSTGKHD